MTLRSFSEGNLSSGSDVLVVAERKCSLCCCLSALDIDAVLTVCFTSSSDEILGSHERIQVYHKFASDVPVRMMLRDTVDKTLTRDV